jgi:hypothetical protein
MRIISKFLPGVFYHTKNIFVSPYWRTWPSPYIGINEDGSLSFRKLDSKTGFPLEIEKKKLEVDGIYLPVVKIGMDKVGLMRIVSQLGIEYPLKYNREMFPTPDYCTILSDCSFGAYKNGLLVYRATI